MRRRSPRAGNSIILRPVVWYRRQAGKQDGFADNKDGQQQAEKNLRDSTDRVRAFLVV